MGVPGKRRRGLTKTRSNPYAERGLDKFALVSAELEAKREKLVAQLGNQLSFVRFAIDSDRRDWIPVFVCPTLSKAELRALKRTATLLITDERTAKDSASAHQIRTPGFSFSGRSVHDGSYERKNVLEHARDRNQAAAHLSVSDDEDMQTCTVGTLGCLFAAAERCLLMAAFTVSIAVDIIGNLFMSKWHAAEAPPKEESDYPSSNMSSSVNFSCLPPIRTRASTPTKWATPSHSPPHVGSPKMRYGVTRQGFSTAPSTPRNSRQVWKAFQASVSFPTNSGPQDEAPRTGIAKGSVILKSVSLPKADRASSRALLRSPQSMAKQTLTEKERKERAEKLGQALTGAGLVLGLGSLVMGYIPAVVCVACWWYALPSLRKAVGDKPHVRSHHL